MKIATLDTWSWRLIYGGLFTAGLGIAVERQGEPLGWALVAGGAAAAVAGVAMIGWRSRIGRAEP